jgi:redox-sensitive bicupin YhaK (pirin superfamily)
MTRSSDEAAVRALYQQLMDGWNQGSGETLYRRSQALRLDPFLMLDEFSSENPDDYVAGFPAHPQRLKPHSWAYQTRSQS